MNGRASITADMATRLAAALETTPQFWLNLQNAVDLHDAAEELAADPVVALRPHLADRAAEAIA